MTNETRNRIEAYKNALPGMKERVSAAAFLLVISIVVMASASFAWLTISRHPEVSNVTTSVTANGNLEIALATSTEAPAESQVGDSSATKGQNIVASNITWGNLVNLSDASYGLENLTLRPAQLNYSSLLDSPLYGAVYQEDGRVEKLNSSFAYTAWNTDLSVFEVSNSLGVRAISSTTVEKKAGQEAAQKVYNKRSAAEEANLAAGSAYTAITNNEAYMNSLSVVMGTFMTANLNEGQGDESLTNPTIEQEDVKNLRDLFGDFVQVYELQFEAMAKLVNYQLYLKNNTESGSTTYTEKTAADIKASTEASLKSQGLQLTGLDQALKDYPKLIDGYAKLQALSEQGEVKWADSGLDEIVNSLMNVGTCTLDGTPINNIGASNATGYLDGETHEAKLTNGVLYNFEYLNGTRCDVRELTVSAKMKRMGITVPASISANISTTAPVPSQFSTDLEYSDTLNNIAKLTEVAQDTYGLAVDLWVRTNASGSYLTLEGNVLTKTEQVRSTGKDANGNTVELWTLTRTREEVTQEKDDEGNITETTETVTVTLDLYQVVTTDTDGNEVITWYNASSYATVTLEDGESPNKKMEDLVTVIGYEGENRIWEDAEAWESNSQLSLDSTTQGSGSCYVYYADTPEDQARSLKLLEAMNVAFVDSTGKLLATAIMDTKMYYAESGRVTVPLVLKNDSINYATNSAGEKLYAITALTPNEPTRISAIVYLDGTKLSNQDVLAASDIQGKLNIQFGSSVTLSHAEDETLLTATRSVSATIDKSSFKYDESIENNKPMTTNVTVSVDGDAPKEVTAFFIREISSTQGSREEEMTFVEQTDGTWKASYTFTAPGNYILRSVELDGQTYDLETCPKVTVEGFTVESLSCTPAENRHVSIMTAAGSSTVDLKLKFASDKVEAMPKTVQGRFLRDSDGTAVNINFTYNSGGANMGYWTGQATFISSGEYTLEYLVLDGEYTQLDEGMVQTATVYLGMKTAVYTDSPLSFKYVPSEMKDNEKNLYMKVKIMDNTGKAMEGLQDAHLYYMMEGSAILENGFNAPLTWDAESGYYTCTFTSKVGVFKFSHVTVKSNTITYAEDSPLFRVISPEPPSYVGYTQNSYMYSADGGITMNARLSYSSTATVAAQINNLDDGKEYLVQAKKESTISQEDIDGDGVTTQVETWHFEIPATADGKQDGNWELTEVYVWNYYDKDGNYIKAEVDSDGKLVVDGQRDDPLVFTMDGGNVTKAVTTLTVTVNLPSNYDAHLGNSETSGSDVKIATATATFLDTQNVTVPTVTIVDFENKPLGTTDSSGNFNSLVSDVKFVYDYNGDSSKYGGYTSSSVNKTDGILTVNLTSTDGETFAQTGTPTVQYAGVYTPKLSYTVDGKTYTKTAEELGATSPTFAVWSKKPYVKITGVSLTSSVNTKITWTTNGLGTPTFTASENKTNSYSDYNATLYASATVDNSKYGNRHGFFAEPKLTISVYEVASGYTTTIKLPAGSNSEIIFERTGNGSVQKEIGSVSTIKYFGVGDRHYLEGYTGHGNVSITSMALSKDGVSYVVNLDNPLTITNPSSVNQLN